MLNVNAGGNFEVTFANANGDQHTCFGVYTEVIKPFKLSFTWTWKSEPGVESLVTVKLIPEKEFTRMHFEHANVGTASAHNYSEGWKQLLKN